MSKILVTGGAGFLGSHITNLLVSKGHEVVVLDNLSKGSKESVNPKATLVVGDIADPIKTKQSLQGVKAVIHMAGLIVVPESVKNPGLYAKTNVLGSVNFLNCMKEENVKKIIFSSSACVYGTPKSLPITENEQLHPDNPYGASKAAIEAFLQAYYASFNFDVTILRYFNPYGPGELHNPETHAIPNFIKATLAKKPIPLYWKGEQIRDFIYIDDLVSSHVEVLDLKGFNIFNVGTETGVKVKDVIDKIFEIVGYSVPLQDLGKREGDAPANYASGKKITAAVGWKAKVNLETGLKKTINYFKTVSSQKP